MKQFFLLVCLMGTTLFTQAQPPKGDAKPGSVYGAKISASGAKDASELPALLKTTDDGGRIPVKIKGTIVDVCSKKGCWAKVQINEQETAFVKMKDYAFFLPTAVKGKTVVIDGEAYTETTSVEELRHYAEDAKKSQAEINAIEQPNKMIRITANGIRVVEGS